MILFLIQSGNLLIIPYQLTKFQAPSSMKKRTISNAYQIPPVVMVNEENKYQEYKGHSKWLSLKSSYLTQKKFFGMTLLHAHAQYIYIVNTKYQKPSVKALVQVDFPVYAQAKSLFKSKEEPEDHWSYIAPLIAEDMLKSAVIEEKTFKHSPWAGADNPLGPKFSCQQVGLITMVICCKFTKNPFNLWLYTHLFMI